MTTDTVFIFSDAVPYGGSYYFPGYNVGLHFESVQCNGSEPTLNDCPKTNALVMDASIYGNNVGVQCYNETRKYTANKEEKITNLYYNIMRIIIRL